MDFLDVFVYGWAMPAMGYCLFSAMVMPLDGIFAEFYKETNTKTKLLVNVIQILIPPIPFIRAILRSFRLFFNYWKNLPDQ